jgi:hypothetical protein
LKRVIICLALAIAVVFATTAFAATKTFKGTDAAGGTVKFTAVIHHGDITKVRGFQWADIPMTCDEPNQTTSGNFTFSAPVNNKHKFTFNGSNGTSTATVHGKFKTRRKAVGTFRLHGSPSPGTQDNCDTGLTNWKAHRT